MFDDDIDVAEFAASKAGYKMLVDPDEIIALLKTIEHAALDFETTSLSPWEGEIRITSICNDDVHFLIDHKFAGAFSKYAPHMLDAIWYVYNAKFEMRWVDHCLFEQCKLDRFMKIYDVDFMAKSVIGGHATSLARMCKRDLGLTLVKEEQRSDWSQVNLRQSQYDYAAYDSYVTWKLYRKWVDEMNDGHWRGFHIFNDAVRGTVECEVNGLPLDTIYHSEQIWTWHIKRDTHEAYLRRYANLDQIKNLRSKRQVGNFIKKNFPKELVSVWPQTEKRGDLKLDRTFMKSVARTVPYPINRWVAAYIGFTYHDKYISTYGEPLIENYKKNGAVLSRFNIAQARTGRYSSSSSNLQNIPRKIAVRKAFSIKPESTSRLILADYKGVEIRTLAEISGDEQLLHDAIYGDVHVSSAALIYHISEDEVNAALARKGTRAYYVMKERRAKAKGFTFQLLYGAAPPALSVVLGSSIQEAEEAVIKWAERYSNAYHYRFKMNDIMVSTGMLPVHSGRQIYVFRDDRTVPVAANYPVQGAAADVMYRAVHHCHRLFDKYRLDANLCATVHDELLSKSHIGCAEEAMSAQLEAMTLAWTDIFPGSNTDNLTDYAIGTAWSDKP